MDEKYTVCIGRQYGSGGREVGALVAEKLGVTCYDKLLIQEAARKSGMDETFLKNNEERLTEVLLPFSGNTFADEANMAGVFYSAGENAYGAEKQAIVSIADRESAVIIGRCASSILSDRKNALSVFLYANETDCVARIAQRNGLTERKARERMERINRMRRHYFNFYSMTEMMARSCEVKVDVLGALSLSCKHWKMAECSLSTGSSCTPCFSTACVTR